MSTTATVTAAATAARNFATVGRKIVCIGRNYRDHALELNNPIPKKPLIFLKPPSSYIQSGEALLVPKNCEVHHEVELGVVIGKEGSNIPECDAMELVDGYCLALDMTARNIQEQAKQKGHPWSISKGFDTFCPVSHFIDKSMVPSPSNLRLWLSVNGHARQEGNTSDMIFSIPYLISHVSQIFKLEPGDVILTGTPAGVGPVFDGELITAGLEPNIASLSIPVKQRMGGEWGA